MTKKEMLEIMNDCFVKLEALERQLQEITDDIRTVVRRMEALPTEVDEIDEDIATVPDDAFSKEDEEEK